jgi:hypothetical protein
LITSARLDNPAAFLAKFRQDKTDGNDNVAAGARHRVLLLQAVREQAAPTRHWRAPWPCAVQLVGDQ